MNMDPSTVSRIVSKVSLAIARLCPRYVKMPDQQNIIKMQRLFYNIAKFPKIIGLVDGAHVRIQSPGGNDVEVFQNRTRYFSWNVQVVAGADLKFQDVVARWPGSAHDDKVFANSNLRTRFEADEFPNCILLGDSGYPLKQYFLTHLANPMTRAENVCNEAHIRTRNLVEKLIEIWKRRFPIVAYGCHLKPETTKAVIVATAVLHNIARDMNEPEPPVPEDVNPDELNYLIQTEDINIDTDNHNNMNITQNEMINYFYNLR